MGIVSTDHIEFGSKTEQPFSIGKSHSHDISVFKGLADSPSKQEILRIASTGDITFFGQVDLVGGIHIADNSVSESKLVNLAVTTDKIAQEAVTGEKIANATITKDKLAFSVLSEDSATVKTSDIRAKENFETIADPIEKILVLQGYTYNLRGTERRDAGIIAQDLLRVLPEGVRQNHQTGLYEVDYSAVVALLVNAVREQQSQIESLETKIRQLDRKVDTLNH